MGIEVDVGPLEGLSSGDLRFRVMRVMSQRDKAMTLLACIPMKVDDRARTNYSALIQDIKAGFPEEDPARTPEPTNGLGSPISNPNTLTP
jgi:hypothetical protein